MKYFITPQNTIRAFEDDGSQDLLIDENMKPISGLPEQPWEIDYQAGTVLHTEPQYDPKTKFTSLEYLDRFTQAEQELIVTATGQNVQLKLFYDRLLAATFIDLEDPRTAAGIDALIAAGLFGSSRKAELLQPE